MDAAKSFITLIQRRHDTLLAVMRAIVAVQRDFFINEDDDTLLKPLTLKDIAEKVGMDISTVSRVTSTKYVQTAYGLYPLKFFFSLQFTTSDGDELSAREVKAALKNWSTKKTSTTRWPMKPWLPNSKSKATTWPAAPWPNTAICSTFLRRACAKFTDKNG